MSAINDATLFSENMNTRQRANGITSIIWVITREEIHSEGIFVLTICIITRTVQSKKLFRQKKGWKR